MSDLLTTFGKGTTCAACGDLIEAEEVRVVLRTTTLLARASNPDEGYAKKDVLVDIDWTEQDILHELCWSDLLGAYRKAKLLDEVKDIPAEYIELLEDQDGLPGWLKYKGPDDLRSDIALWLRERDA